MMKNTFARLNRLLPVTVLPVTFVLPITLRVEGGRLGRVRRSWLVTCSSLPVTRLREMTPGR